MTKNFGSEDFVYELMHMNELERSDTIEAFFNSKTINFAEELDKINNKFSDVFSNALEADNSDPDAAADDDDDGADPDAAGDDKKDDAKDEGGDDDNADPDAGGDDDESDPDYTKGSDPDAGGDNQNSDPDAGGSPAPAGGGNAQGEPPKDENEKEEKNKDISERIHLFKNYKRLSAMTESLINGMQGFIDYALSMEDRSVVLRIKQELIKTSGQLEFAMALNFKTADKEKLEELYDIINRKIQRFMEALEKVRKSKNNPNSTKKK